jgi:diacylglycerol kinase (ATP)
MTQTGTYRVALAVNPTSGQGRGQRAGAIAEHLLNAAGCDVQVLIGKDAADLRGQLQHTLSPSAVLSGHRRPDALVLTGGDGMVHLGVNALAATGWEVPMGIIAAGTGNDVARALNLPIHDPAAAARDVLTALNGGVPRRIDVVDCTEADGTQHWFAGVLGAGFDAVVNERANRWSWPRNRARYVLATLRELPVFRPRAYTLTLDGQQWRTRAMLVAVANTPSYGGGMRVCPDAQVDDGLLDVLVVRPVPAASFLTIFPRVYSGTHVRDRRVEIRRARQVTVHAAQITGYADGERIAGLPLHCSVVPGALQVLTGGGGG